MCPEMGFVLQVSVILKAADSLRFQTKLWTNSSQIDSFPTAIFAINACPSHYTMKQEPPRALNNLSPRREENTKERKATSSLSHSLSHSPFGPEADLALPSLSPLFSFQCTLNLRTLFSQFHLLNRAFNYFCLFIILLSLLSSCKVIPLFDVIR